MPAKLPAFGLFYAAAIALCASTAMAEEPAKTTEGAWEITQTKSPVDDSLQVSAVNVAPEAASEFLSNKPGAVVVRCKDQTTELIVATNGFLGLALAGATVKLIYRVGGDPAVTKQWPLSDNGKGAFYPGSPITFIRSLPTDGSLLIRLYNSQGSYEEAIFSLDGLDAVRELVSQACHWPPPKN